MLQLLGLSTGKDVEKLQLNIMVAFYPLRIFHLCFCIVAEESNVENRQ